MATDPTTNVPLPTFTQTGLSLPSEQDILNGNWADWSAAFALIGKTLNQDLTSPQGQLISSQSYMIQAFFAALAQMIALMDPLTTYGKFQDALGRIYFLTRQSATYATVPATVRGTTGQVLPAGAQARSATDGTIWATQDAATFGADGTALVTFQAVDAGAVPTVAIGGLAIYQQSTGWESVYNRVASSPGVATESRQSFETRRYESVYIGGMGQAATVRAAVANVPGVSDVYVYNNGGDDPVTYGATDYYIKGHSIAICLTGGDDDAIAAAIHSKLDCGCGLPTQAGKGTLVTVDIEDTVNYTAPYPSYPVTFVRAAATQVYFTIQVADTATLPATYIRDIQKVVADVFANGYLSEDGTINIARARIGGQIVAAEYLTPVLAETGAVPVQAFVSFAAQPTSGTAVIMGIDQQPVSAALNVYVQLVELER